MRSTCLLSITIALTTTLLVACPARADEQDTCAHSLESAARLRASRRLLVATALLRECAASEACGTETRARCASQETDLKKAIPTITVITEGGTLTIDRTPAASGVALEVDPGSHVVSWASVDGQRREANVVVTEQERARIVLVTPVVPASAAQASSQAPPSSATNGPYIVGGAGLALLLGAAVLQTFARVEDAHAQSLVRDGLAEDSASRKEAYYDSADSHYDAAQVDQTFAIALATLGITTVAVGVTWWATSRTPSPPRASTPASLARRGSGVLLRF
jgi:hypothetical protein